MGVHHHKAPIVTDGLVFHVDAGNKITNSATVKDISNMVNPLQEGSFNNMLPPIEEGSFKFDGSDEYIDMADALPSIQNNSKGTIDIWFKLNDLTRQHLFSAGLNANNTDIYVTYLSGNFFVVCEDNSAGVFTIRTNGFTINQDKYYNATITQNGTRPTIYMNGVSQTMDDLVSTDLTKWFNDFSFDKLTIGADDNNGGRRFWTNGFIPSIKVYNRDLTDSEIEQNYNATKHRFE